MEALDRDVKKAKENPGIGVLLCKDKDDEVVEYALNRSLSPTLVAEYQLCLPDKKILRQKMRERYSKIQWNRYSAWSFHLHKCKIVCIFAAVNDKVPRWRHRMNHIPSYL